MSSTTEESTAPESPANNVNGDLSEQIQALQRRIEILESENTHLRSLIPDGDGKDTKEYGGEDKCGTCPGDPAGYSAGILTRDQIERYSRQLLIHGGFGVEGQTKLLSSSVLVVGAGGIGSTGTNLNFSSATHGKHKELIGAFLFCFSDFVFGSVWSGSLEYR